MLVVVDRSVGCDEFDRRDLPTFSSRPDFRDRAPDFEAQRRRLGVREQRHAQRAVEPPHLHLAHRAGVPAIETVGQAQDRRQSANPPARMPGRAARTRGAGASAPRRGGSAPRARSGPAPPARRRAARRARSGGTSACGASRGRCGIPRRAAAPHRTGSARSAGCAADPAADRVEQLQGESLHVFAHAAARSGIAPRTSERCVRALRPDRRAPATRARSRAAGLREFRSPTRSLRVASMRAMTSAATARPARMMSARAGFSPGIAARSVPRRREQHVEQCARSPRAVPACRARGRRTACRARPGAWRRGW